MNSKDLRMQFGMWLGLPPEARDPKEQRDLAKQLGIREENLSRLKQDPIVLEAQRNALQMFAGGHKFNIVKTMIERAETGTHLDRRLYFEYMGDLKRAKTEEDKTPPEIKVTIVKANVKPENTGTPETT